MTVGPEPRGRPLEAPAEPRPGRDRLTTAAFDLIEQGAYVIVGLLLAVTALIALAGAGLLLWQGFFNWARTGEVFEVVERLLFVLMMVEIIHTVSTSIRNPGLSVQPFLIVGLIASIRRMLMITLETTEITRHGWTDQVQSRFSASLLELAVLGLTVLILVVSIYLLRRVGPPRPRGG